MTLHPDIIPNHAGIKNIIFDFGGVLCDINIARTEQKFHALGLTEFNPQYSVSKADTIFGKFEDGSLSALEFRNAIRSFFPNPITDQEIDEAWNAMLLDLPEERIELLEKVKKSYKIYLLSNSNEIHFKKFSQEFQRIHGYNNFNDLFIKAFFSFQVRMKKPDREIFDHVIKDQGLNPAETLFIDDSLQHVHGANSAGLHAFHLDLSSGMKIVDLFLD